MKIAGIVKSSLIDYPGKASTVIFLGGCNFRCGYCHNPDIVSFEGEGICLSEFFAFLEKRRRFIDAVCISGGEPTIWTDLYDLIRDIKCMDMKVKLDTNGSNPDMLDRLLSQRLIDYVAMDIKGPLRKYAEITGVMPQEGFDCIWESSRMLREGNCHYEFRTTLCKELLTAEDLKEMIEQHPGYTKWFLQNYRDSGKRIDRIRKFTPYDDEELKDMGAKLCVSAR